MYERCELNKSFSNSSKKTRAWPYSTTWPRALAAVCRNETKSNWNQQTSFAHQKTSCHREQDIERGRTPFCPGHGNSDRTNAERGWIYVFLILDSYASFMQVSAILEPSHGTAQQRRHGHRAWTCQEREIHQIYIPPSQHNSTHMDVNPFCKATSAFRTLLPWGLLTWKVEHSHLNCAPLSRAYIFHTEEAFLTVMSRLEAWPVLQTHGNCDFRNSCKLKPWIYKARLF